MAADDYYDDSVSILLRTSAVNFIEEHYMDTPFNAMVPYMAMTYHDRFVSRHPIPTVVSISTGENIKLFWICCLAISWKLNSKSFKLSDFLKQRNFEYSQKELLKMEISICRGLMWRFSRPIRQLIVKSQADIEEELTIERTGKHPVVGDIEDDPVESERIVGPVPRANTADGDDLMNFDLCRTEVLDTTPDVLPPSPPPPVRHADLISNIVKELSDCCPCFIPGPDACIILFKALQKLATRKRILGSQEASLIERIYNGEVPTHPIYMRTLYNHAHGTTALAFVYLDDDRDGRLSILMVVDRAVSSTEIVNGQTRRNRHGDETKFKAIPPSLMVLKTGIKDATNDTFTVIEEQLGDAQGLRCLSTLEIFQSRAVECPVRIGYVVAGWEDTHPYVFAVDQLAKVRPDLYKDPATTHVIRGFSGSGALYADTSVNFEIHLAAIRERIHTFNSWDAVVPRISQKVALDFGIRGVCYATHNDPATGSPFDVIHSYLGEHGPFFEYDRRGPFLMSDLVVHYPKDYFRYLPSGQLTREWNGSIIPKEAFV